MSIGNLERGKAPVEWCATCPVATQWEGTSNSRRKEPCATIMEEYLKTGRGSGMEDGETTCMASLQAEYNCIPEELLGE